MPLGLVLTPALYRLLVRVRLVRTTATHERKFDSADSLGAQRLVATQSHEAQREPVMSEKAPQFLLSGPSRGDVTTRIQVRDHGAQGSGRVPVDGSPNLRQVGQGVREAL